MPDVRGKCCLYPERHDPTGESACLKFEDLSNLGIEPRLMTPYIAKRREWSRLMKQEIFADFSRKIGAKWVPYMTNETIMPAAEVVTRFLHEQAKNEGLDPDTLKTVGALRDDDKLTKTNLLRQLEALRKAAINTAADEGGEDD